MRIPPRLSVPRLSLPLLTKELIEQAQNKRTYNLRVAYAVVLYGLALWQFRELSQGGGSASLMNLGRGQVLVDQLIYAQAIAILFLLPAITCGALTVEKEKDTLALLLLTKLSPLTIVTEKLLSRVFAMGTFQLLSLPLFAIIYGIGGVEISGLITAVVRLGCLTLIVGSISVLCSTWFRTTSEAFVMSYCLLLLSFIGVNAFGYLWYAFWMWLLPAYRLTPWGVPLATPLRLFLTVAVAALFSGAILLIASRVLVTRAFVPPRNIILELFQRADRFFNDLNARTTGGVVLVTDDQSLPLFQPISWRETRKKSLGTFRYQFRILMLLLIPLIVVIAALLTDGRGDFTSPFRGFPAFFWLVSIICLTIHSTGVIPSERVRQSLDVLLVAPLASSEIVLEKLSGVRRMIKLLSVPFAVSILFQAVWSGYILQDSTLMRDSDFWKELVSTSLATFVYMPLIMWVGFVYGLWFRTQMQAVLATFATLAVVCVIPLIAARASLPALDLNLTFLRWLSPLQMVFSTSKLVPGFDLSQSNPVFAWLTLANHFILFGFAWWSLRFMALRHFSRIVGRTEMMEMR